MTTRIVGTKRVVEGRHKGIIYTLILCNTKQHYYNGMFDYVEEV
jgi:hypothetical protein